MHWKYSLFLISMKNSLHDIRLSTFYQQDELRALKVPWSFQETGTQRDITSTATIL
ncbi:hypothetical protein [Gimesia maris]|uniref:hypothetical protein n=1 Tax=Gimesia maris TaxID=122 RepID=UPI0001542B0B|nr:hypothetical protein [Gimesia maris]EDL57317.1 hypothetical protein PM8797T_30666 [Gimesia maris DSM 8797]